jgi:uncharacterized membrane protein
MNIDFSQIAPIVWIVAAVLVVVVVIVVIRFFWQHILKFALQGCAVILAILALLYLLHYLKVF